MVKDWRRILRNARRGHWDKLLAAAYRPYFRLRGPPDSTPIPEKDWDYLVVLDACRYDVFAEHHPFEEGHLEKCVSRGSTSIEYFNRNFTAYHDDIVYVSANGHTSPTHESRFQRKLFDGNRHFHDLVELYLEDDPRDEVKLTPEFVVERALETVAEHPGKRVALHMMSPHAPYLAADAETAGWNIRDYALNGYDQDAIMDLYVADLLRACEAVQEFIGAVEGKIVITADHGETFGEHGLYMHPHGVYFRELVEVPWYVVDQGGRPDIQSADTGGLDI